MEIAELTVFSNGSGKKERQGLQFIFELTNKPLDYEHKTLDRNKFIRKVTYEAGISCVYHRNRRRHVTPGNIYLMDLAIRTCRPAYVMVGPRLAPSVIAFDE
jgi:hypothetical protein